MVNEWNGRNYFKCEAGNLGDEGLMEKCTSFYEESPSFLKG
jgi:hypothetical protein